jgi:hypothetical protein
VSGEYAGSAMGWTEVEVVVVVVVVVAAVAVTSLIDIAPVAAVHAVVVGGGGNVAMLRDSEELIGRARGQGWKRQWWWTPIEGEIDEGNEMAVSWVFGNCTMTVLVGG